MDQKTMLRLADLKEDAYWQTYPDTADTDLHIFRSYYRGQTVHCIAFNTNFSESTVYRRIWKVESFLNWQEPEMLLDKLRIHIAKNLPDLGDGNAQSILEMLHCAFSDRNSLDSAKSEEGFARLTRMLNTLPPIAADPVLGAVTELCRLHQRDGFTEGIKLGFQLNEELKH